MKRRILKKRTMKVVRDLSEYTGVPAYKLKSECYDDIKAHVKKYEIDELYVYFDCKAIELMEREG